MRQGKMNINSIVFSSTLSELHELRDPELSVDLIYTNWFSSEYTQKVYGDFLKMDVDRNGMISRNELASYRNGNLTKSFLDRIFLNVQLFNGGMVRVQKFAHFLCLGLFAIPRFRSGNGKSRDTRSPSIRVQDA